MKTIFTDGNPLIAIPGTTITAALMTALNSPKFSSQDIDGHFNIAVEDACAYGDGSISRATLDAAITAAGANETIILLRRGDWQLGASALTIPANIHLLWAPGSFMSGAADITVNGAFINIPNWIIFTNTGTVTFAAGITNYLGYILWFGSDAAAKNKMLAAFGSSSLLYADITVANNPIVCIINGIEILRITSTGAGIGTPNPIGKLEIYDDASGGTVILSRDTGTTRGLIRFGRHNAGVFQETGIIAGLSDSGSVNNGKIVFYTSDNAGTDREVARINSLGYLGIGTTDPKSKLHATGLPIYANNAAAIAGGLTAGAFYRTGADPDPICVVH